MPISAFENDSRHGSHMLDQEHPPSLKPYWIELRITLELGSGDQIRPCVGGGTKADKQQEGRQMDGQALYIMEYVGATGGAGAGVLYIGNGQVVGTDILKSRYKGSYTIEGGRVKVEAALTAPTTLSLVTGAMVNAGQSIRITADLPMHFGSGMPVQVTVGGQPVKVRLEKVGDIE